MNNKIEVMRINWSIAIISSRVDISLSSESIRFSFKMTKMKVNNKVELKKKLGE